MEMKKKGSIFPIFVFIFAFLFSQGLNIIPVAAKSTIRFGEELNYTSQLVSENGIFTLGFFTIQATNNSYLGICYTNDVFARKVWVANRNTPITYNSALLLRFDSSGELIISSGIGINIVPVFDTGTGNSAVATLADSGNFILTNETGKQKLWESFDHPSNVLLPGMKLGYNLTTRQNWTLTSYLSDDILSSGAFTLSWVDSGQLVIHRRGELYWTSGPFDNQKFMFMPLLNDPSIQPYHYELDHQFDDQGNYFTFNAIDGNFLMWILSPNGNISVRGSKNFYISSPDEFCYGYQLDNGCVSTTLPSCRKRNDNFTEMRAYFVHNTDISYDDNSSLSISDCMERCWEDCNCVGFRSNSNGTGCIFWTGSNKYEIDDRGAVELTYVLVSDKKSSKVEDWVWIVVAAVAVVLIVLALGLFCYLRKKKLRIEGEEKKRREYLHELTASDSFQISHEIENGGNQGHDLKMFSFGSILAATNNFSPENKLGEGGFGPVYKGKLAEGREIAVKRLSRTSGQGVVEFKNELILIAKVQHMNLVRVVGCCIHGQEMMLIYEYLPNKSLDSFLFDPTKRELLDWKMRFNIIEGISQGLLYLHKYSRMRVIHRDLKASNILLDENMNPKISDFGMARIFKPNETEAITNRVVGTYGYMSPEYAMEGTFSVKSDVFSFGVLILEIVSGRRNNSLYDLDRPINLIGYAWELWKQGCATELKDPSLGHSIVIDQVLRTIHVGLLCVQENATDRPTMSDVISMLTNETMTLPPSKQPAFFTGRIAPESSSSEIKSKECSVNEMTISLLEARI